jgi:hypothetical protein
MADMPDIATAIWQSPDAQTVEISFQSTGGAGTTAAIFQPDAGKRFAVHYIRIHFQNLQQADIQFRSGSGTNLSGVFTFDGTNSTGPPAKSDFLEVHACGMPIFIGRANGDAFSINATNNSGATDLRGWAVVTEIAGVL